MRGSLKFAYEALNCIVTNWVALNRTMQSQQRTASAYRDVTSLLFWDNYKALSGNSLLMFQDNLSISSSRVKKSKTEKTPWLMLPYTIFLSLGLCPSSNFLEKQDISASSISDFRQRSTYPGGPIRLRYSQSLDSIKTLTCYDMYLRTY
jgi:hypothetical protein